VNKNNSTEIQSNCASCFGNKNVGSVTPEERDEIRALFERKNGLAELFRSLVTLDQEELEKSNLYERIVADMGSVTTRFQQWWADKSKKYSWEDVKGYQWEIDFDTCTIFLRK
jgi:CXXX repeat modification system protein